MGGPEIHPTTHLCLFLYWMVPRKTTLPISSTGIFLEGALRTVHPLPDCFRRPALLSSCPRSVGCHIPTNSKPPGWLRDAPRAGGAETGPAYGDCARLHLSEQKSGNNLDIQQPGASVDTVTSFYHSGWGSCSEEEVTAQEMEVMILCIRSRFRLQRWRAVRAGVTSCLFKSDMPNDQRPSHGARGDGKLRHRKKEDWANVTKTTAEVTASTSDGWNPNPRALKGKKWEMLEQ